MWNGCAAIIVIQDDDNHDDEDADDDDILKYRSAFWGFSVLRDATYYMLVCV